MIRLFFFLSFFFLASSQGVFGATDTFTVRTLIGGDIIPPTTPVLLSAMPVSTMQIDLSWSVSTDNVLLGGYHIFRDSVLIATSTLTSFSDGGLLVSTTYNYSVRAFDIFNNYSTTSNAIATTTLSVIATTSPPTATTSTSYGYRRPPALTLEYFEVIPDTRTAKIHWRTSTFARFTLRWGRTSSYELGSVSHELLRKTHTTEVTGLEPGTTYQFELVGYTENGKMVVLKRGDFDTKVGPDILAPTNVQNLRAYVVADKVLLSWNNPTDPDFAGVRVLRSHLFYPQSRTDGFLLADSTKESVTDADAFVYGKVAYYTVFTYDKSGNVSSGAIVSVTTVGKEVSVDRVDVSTTSLYQIAFSDVEFEQNGVLVDKESLRAGVPFFVRIAYEKVPEHLKTITITLGASEDVAYSYLLKINQDKTYYEASIKNVWETETVPARVALYDFQTKLLHITTGDITFSSYPYLKNVYLLEPLVTTLAIPSEVATFFLFIFILYLVSFFLFQKSEREDNTPTQIANSRV